MELKQKKCKNCGGELVLKGKSWECTFCATKYMDESIDNPRLERAYSLLHNNDFENAERECDDVIARNKKDYEAYWVRAQARNRITFVDDIGGKKIPTCNNIGGRMFSEDADVKNAIAYAPSEIKTNYIALSKKIDDISKEWLEKASKEPEYDIFICYKQTEKDENGKEIPTPDSIYLLNLYARLSKTYRVFFSQVSLVDKMGEHYEPYIYNSLKTAKVMIVYAEKAEYFNAPWLKNEWTRYIERIKNGEKEAASLIVAHRGVDPYQIPKALLGGRQALDMAGAAAGMELEDKIEALIEAASKAGKLGTIKIEGGQIGKKASQIKQGTINKREIGGGAVKQSLDENDLLSSVKYLIEKNNPKKAHDNTEQAKKILNQIFSMNPKSAEGIKYEILLSNNCKMEKELSELTSFNGIARLNDFFGCASKAQAESMLDILYHANSLSEEEYLKILNIILPFDYPNRNRNIDSLFNWSSKKGYSKIFDLLILTLSADDVDKYILLNLEYAENRISEQRYEIAKEYIDKVLAVDEGNARALTDRIKTAITLKESNDAIIKTLETALHYSKNINAVIVDLMEFILSIDFNEYTDSLVRKIIQYYQGEPDASFIQILMRTGEAFLNRQAFGWAKNYFNIVRSYDAKNFDALMYLCFCQLEVSSEAELNECDTPIEEADDYNFWFGRATDDQKDLISAIVDKQENCIAKRKEERNRKEQEQREKREQKQREKREQEKKAEEMRLVAAAKALENLRLNRRCKIIGLAFYTAAMVIISVSSLCYKFLPTSVSLFGDLEGNNVACLVMVVCSITICPVFGGIGGFHMGNWRGNSDTNTAVSVIFGLIVMIFIMALVMIPSIIVLSNAAYGVDFTDDMIGVIIAFYMGSFGIALLCYIIRFAITRRNDYAP